MLFLSICECIFVCLKVCLCLSEYTNICVCFCPRACLCVCGKAREQPTLCRLCTSCVGHVEEDVSGGHVLAAGREEGSPVLCLEAQTLGVALRTAQSCVCVCTCVSEKSFSMKTSGAVAVQVFIKSDKRVNTLTPRKTHTHTHTLPPHKKPSLLRVVLRSQCRHPACTHCAEFAAKGVINTFAGCLVFLWHRWWFWPLEWRGHTKVACVASRNQKHHRNSQRNIRLSDSDVMLTDLDYLRDNIGLLCAVITFV